MMRLQCLLAISETTKRVKAVCNLRDFQQLIDLGDQVSLLANGKQNAGNNFSSRQVKDVSLLWNVLVIMGDDVICLKWILEQLKGQAPKTLLEFYNKEIDYKEIEHQATLQELPHGEAFDCIFLNFIRMLILFAIDLNFPKCLGFLLALLPVTEIHQGGMFYAGRELMFSALSQPILNPTFLCAKILFDHGASTNEGDPRIGKYYWSHCWNSNRLQCRRTCLILLGLQKTKNKDERRCIAREVWKLRAITK